MTPARPAMRGHPWLGFACSLLIIASCSAARAESPLPALFTSLGLVRYPPRAAPPEFAGVGLDAGTFSTTALRGKVVLVNFWASWCLDCRPEMPVLERLHRELTPRGLVIVGVNAGEKPESIRRFTTELGITFPVVLDVDRKISALYGVVGLPTTFVVGRNGRGVAFAVGPRQWGGAPARALFDALLAEEAPRP